MRAQLAVCSLLAALIVGPSGQRSAGRAANSTPNDLFRLTNIANVQLEFTKSDYEALAPRGGGGWFGSGGGSAQSWLQGPEGKRNGFAASRGVQFSYVHGSVTINGQTLKDVGVRYKGNGTYFEGAAKGKVSLKLDFAEYVKGQKLGTLKKLNLHSNITDASLMNEVLAFQLFRDAGVPAPRTSYARVYVTVQGQKQQAYAGLFSIVENPDEQFVAARGLPSGAIFKPVVSQLFADLGPDWKRYNQTYDPKTTLTDAHKQRVIDFARLVSGGTDAQFAARVGEFLDLEETARYLAVVVFLSDMDGLLGPGQNYYLYLDQRSNKFGFVPWDLDAAWGNFWVGSKAEQQQSSIWRPWVGENRFLERVMVVEEFRRIYRAHLEDFMARLYVPERLNRRIDTIAAAIREPIAAESPYRLDKFDQAVGLKPVAPWKWWDVLDFPASDLKQFIAGRARSVRSQLAGESQGILLKHPKLLW